MKITFKDRTVVADATPRFIDAKIFFSDWIGDCEKINVKNPGTAEWSVMGRHRLFGFFFARWAKDAVGDVVLCASQV